MWYVIACKCGRSCVFVWSMTTFRNSKIGVNPYTISNRIEINTNSKQTYVLKASYIQRIERKKMYAYRRHRIVHSNTHIKPYDLLVNDDRFECYSVGRTNISEILKLKWEEKKKSKQNISVTRRSNRERKQNSYDIYILRCFVYSFLARTNESTSERANERTFDRTSNRLWVSTYEREQFYCNMYGALVSIYVFYCSQPIPYNILCFCFVRSFLEMCALRSPYRFTRVSYPMRFHNADMHRHTNTHINRYVRMTYGACGKHERACVSVVTAKLNFVSRIEEPSWAQFTLVCFEQLR